MVYSGDILGANFYAGTGSGYSNMAEDGLHVYSESGLQKVWIGYDDDYSDSSNGGAPTIELGSSSPLVLRKFYDGTHQAWIGSTTEDETGFHLDFSDGTVQIFGGLAIKKSYGGTGINWGTADPSGTPPAGAGAIYFKIES